MLPYWLLFAFFAAGALLQSLPSSTRRPNLLFSFGAIAMGAMIGLRFKIGADWRAYERMLERTGHGLWSDAVSVGDVGYQTLNFAAAQLGVGLWFVNSVCALVFTWGLFRFARTQPNPWLTVLIAVPYMVIVVAMGYSRQGAALGIALAGLADFLRRGSILRLAAIIAFAALFHSTAVVVFPLVAIAANRARFVNYLIVLSIGYLFYTLFIERFIDTFIQTYIGSRYASQGAAIRVAINCIAALVFFAASRRIAFSPTERAIWRNFALAALALSVGLLVSPSSTAVDRLAIYIMPLQLAVFSRLAIREHGALMARTAVVSYSAAVLFVWLFFADHARYWLPYRSYLFWNP